MLPKKPSLAILTFGALILLLELTRFARPVAPAAALDFRPRTTVAPEEPVRTQPPALFRNKIVIEQHDSIGPN